MGMSRVFATASVFLGLSLPAAVLTHFDVTGTKSSVATVGHAALVLCLPSTTKSWAKDAVHGTAANADARGLETFAVMVRSVQVAPATSQSLQRVNGPSRIRIKGGN